MSDIESENRKTRLKELLAANHERFKCEHGATMYLTSDKGCAGTWNKCGCCSSYYCDYRGKTSLCWDCRPKNPR